MSVRCLDCGQFTGDSPHTCPDPLQQFTDEVTETGDRVVSCRGEPMSEEELLDVLDVDLETWKVTRRNHWEQRPGEWLHQLRLKPRTDLIDAGAIVEGAIEDLRAQDPDLPESPDTDDGEYMLELNITDHHLGLLAWAAETRDSNYDHKIAERLYLWAVEELVERAQQLPGTIDQVVLVIGNDMLHVDVYAGDGSGGATTAGTVQDVDSRRKKLGRVLVRMVRSAVRYLLTVCGDVKIVVVPGNHDEDASFSLGMVAEALFEGDSRVTVDNSAPLRKYHQYGNVLLGYAHGKDEGKTRLPMLMPTEVPEMWADTKHREFHVGHVHSKHVRGFHMETDEDMSVRIRVFPSLAPSDAWHTRKGYKAVRAAEAYLWHREHGFSGMLSATPRSADA